MINKPGLLSYQELIKIGKEIALEYGEGEDDEPSAKSLAAYIEMVTQAQRDKDYKEMVRQIKEDGIWCPRCGEVFHDKDMDDNPEDYYTCPTCFAIQHEKCRHLPKEKQVLQSQLEEA